MGQCFGLHSSHVSQGQILVVPTNRLIQVMSPDIIFICRRGLLFVFVFDNLEAHSSLQCVMKFDEG